MSSQSRDKGKRGEREWAAWLRDWLDCGNARRGQQHQGGAESPDVVGGINGTHVEVKRRASIGAARFLDQAIYDAGPRQLPYVAMREDRGPWLLLIRAQDIDRFSKSIVLRDRGEL